MWLRFRDGTVGDVDLTDNQRAPVYEALREIMQFKRFSVHPEFHTLVWSNGADLAPEFLHKQTRLLPNRICSWRRAMVRAEALAVLASTARYGLIRRS